METDFAPFDVIEQSGRRPPTMTEISGGPCPHLGSDADDLEQYAFQYGRAYDAYLVTEPGWECFWSQGHRGVVALVRKGKYLFASGGLLAPPEHKRDLLAELVHHAAGLNAVLTFFNIADDDLPLLREFGFQVTKWGEEALVDLTSCTWTGKHYEWVRRQSNFCVRHGLIVSECRRECMSPAEWSGLTTELAEVSATFLAAKPQAGEIRFLQGRFDPLCQGRKRVFVARAEGGKGCVEGFLACNPCLGGTAWTMETYQQRTTAVRGTIPFMFHQAMRILQREGVRQASLCLIPGLRCRAPLPGDSALVRRGMVAGTQHFNLLFDTAAPIISRRASGPASRTAIFACGRASLSARLGPSFACWACSSWTCINCVARWPGGGRCGHRGPRCGCRKRGNSRN